MSNPGQRLEAAVKRLLEEARNQSDLDVFRDEDVARELVAAIEAMIEQRLPQPVEEPETI